MLEYIAITATLALIIWYFTLRPLSYWTNLGVKQSKPWILFGDSFSSVFNLIGTNEFIENMYKMHPEARYSGFYTMTSPTLLVRDPELIKQITVKDFEHFTDHPPNVEPGADPLWSNALLNLKGDRWKQMRSTLSPTFTSSKIKTIYILMADTANNFVKHFLEKDDEIIECDMKDSFSRFTNDIIATTAFGLKVNSLEERDNDFHEMGKKLTSFSTLRFFGHIILPKLAKLLGFSLLNSDVSKYIYAVIDDTIKAREEQNVIRHDMIHLMLEARKGQSKSSVKISNAEIASQAMIFFFAGFDTVSTAMSFGSYELAINKDIQDRLRREIKEIQKDGKVSYEDLMQMKYMDMFVSEVLRKWPPFAFTDRICTKPYTIEPINQDEKPVPIFVNQQVFIPIYGIQRDPKYFPEPEKFDPERFSDENKDTIVPYTFNTFGVGPRLCTGNRFALVEIKALFFNLLLNYEIVPTKRTQIPFVCSKDFAQIPKEGLWLGLKRIRS